MKYLVIWDIHWEYEKLREILDKYFSISDKVIFLWDYIDKNKDSLKTLEFLIGLKKNNLDKVILLWWNHDIFLINSILYKNEKSFYVWFYLNRAYMTTLFGYVPWNDRILFRNWYKEFIEEYFDKISNNKLLLNLSKSLIELWQLYFKDKIWFFIHWWLPINIVNRNEFKNVEIYNSLAEQWLINLEKDYKKWNIKAIDFFSKTIRNDPTWFSWAEIYERITKDTFKKLLIELNVRKIFVWHRDLIKCPKFPKWNLLNSLNMVDKEIIYYYWE